MRKRRKFKARRPMKVRLPYQPKDTTHYIYKITVNNKVYIGYTSRSPYVRLTEHLDNARKGKQNKLYDTLRKYQEEHTFEILKEFDNERDALCCEIEEIKRYPNGLNLTPGGEGRTLTVRGDKDANL